MLTVDHRFIDLESKESDWKGSIYFTSLNY